MKNIYLKGCFVLLFVCLNNLMASGETPGTSKKVFKVAANQEGIIGFTDEVPFDNPVDNIFHIQIDQPLSGEEQAWLVYDLDGVSDHTAVSRSINDNLSVGGYLVRTSEGWATQRERISANWLKQGDNIIRFTIPEGAEYSYRVRNLSIEVYNETSDNRQIIVNQSQTHSIHNDQVYVKGFLLPNDHANGDIENVRLTIGGVETPLFNGEFENVAPKREKNNKWTVEIEAEYPNGQVVCQEVEVVQTVDAEHHYEFFKKSSRAEQQFVGSQDQFIALPGVTLNVPAGAIQEPVNISINTLRHIDIPPLDAGMVNVTQHHAGYRFLPNGTVFEKEAGLHLAFDESKIPDGYTVNDIKTYYFDETSHHWVAVRADTVSAESGEVLSRTNHFTDYINAIIKVPESPETEAYNPTSMKGIKAANPTAGINLIEPPQANNRGGAGMGYPIKIPAGRNGMQPQLAINYNSDGGSGWLGLGWSLNIPSVDIDTRWGSPRYDPINETETYLLNGQQLSPLAHRGELQPRSADKIFHLRVEGAFQRIKRRGSKTDDYWWEVIDKSGVRYFYGGTPETGLDPAAVLRTNEKKEGDAIVKSIAHWALVEVRDPNGNFVRYHYEKAEDAGIGDGRSGIMGHELYVSKITYTGHNGQEGPYSVHFTHDATRRNDIAIDGRLGFKRVTANRLKKIDVKLNDENIRHYELEYTEGAFHKSLLASIKEFDADGSLFTSHEFDYYDDVDFKNGYKPFKSQQPWSVGGGTIRGDFVKRIDGKFDDNASALSGTKSEDNSLGMAVTVGFNVRVWDKTLSVGGSFSSANSESESMLTMIDLNGDGLPDKVYIKDGKLFYRPNESGPSNQEKFGGEEEIKEANGKSISVIFKEKSKTKSKGLEAHGPAVAPVFGGYSDSKTRSEQSVYFTEVNGDQLPDLVVKGKVLFGRINPSTGHPEFVDSSGETPSQIFQSGGIAEELFGDEENDLEKAIKENPLHDVVKVWEAPYAGRIRITAPVRLLESQDEDRADAPADGVRVAIQLKNDEKWHVFIKADDYSVHHPTGVADLTVKKGDKVYFRVGSVFNGSYDQVEWAPVVEYLDLPPLMTTDANAKSYIAYDSREDFKLSAIQKVSPPIKGTVIVESKFIKPVTSDDVYLEIIRETLDPEDPQKILASDTIYSNTYAWDSIPENPDTTFTWNVDQGQQYWFRVLSASNVDWAAVQWQNRMYYSAFDNPDEGEALDENGNPNVVFYPVPEYSIYSKPLQTTEPYAIWSEEDTVSIKVKPRVFLKERHFLLPLVSGDIFFTIKKRNEILFKDTLKVANNELTYNDSTELEVLKDDTLFFEYHIPYDQEKELRDQVVTLMLLGQVELTVNDTVKHLTAGVHAELSEGIVFGPLYRGWGQFVYQANGDRAIQPIVQSDLKVNEDLKNTPKTDPNDLEDGKDLNSDNTYSAADEKFIILIPLGKEQSWIGYDNFTWVSASQISSSRMGDDDLNNAVAKPGSGARAISKITESENSAWSLGGGFGGVGASGTMSNGSSRVVADYMDFNGDRYPDIVVGNRVQFSDARGGLSERMYIHNDAHNMQSSTEASGFSLSASFTTSKSEGGHSFNIKKAAVVSVADGKGSVGLSANIGSGENTTDFTWMDINGDGLPDKVTKTGVSLNLGYGFEKEESWNHGAIQNGESGNEGAGLGLSLWNGSISGGVSLARSDNKVTHSLQDINGDGLVDLLSYNKDNPISVRFNTGAGFSDAVVWKGAYQIGESSSTSQSANVAFTAGIYIPLINIKITVNPSYSDGYGASRELAKLSDIDGDGYPDYLVSNKYDNLKVSLSTIGRTNKLKSVSRPLGSSFTMDYVRVGNTYELPNSMWVLSEVEVVDGFAGDGVDTLRTAFAYENGYYDRHEREFYGFEKVISKTLDDDKKPYAIVTQTFSADNYYEKGLMLSQVMTDGKGKKYTETENVYQLKNIADGANLPDDFKEKDDGAAFPALTDTYQKFYEGKNDPGKTSRVSFVYDKIGNVTSYTNHGEEGDHDDLFAAIAYHSYDYLRGIPKSIFVEGADRAYRKREADIDPATGNVTQIRQYLEDESFAVHDLTYDKYGNLETITRPANHKGERLSFTYEYDETVNTYVEKVTSGYGYSSQATYNLKFGLPLETTDINGHKITYALDNKGRVTQITGPYEQQGAPFTIKFDYFPDAKIPWALTQHYDGQNKGNLLETAIFVDGLGRVLQTKKDAALYRGENKADKEVMVASGRVYFDALGRAVEAYYPTVDETKTPGAFMSDPDQTVPPTKTAYDVLNRTLSVTLPDGSSTTMAYGFGSDRDGAQQFSTKTTDANGITTEQFTDIRGRVTAVKNIDVWTSFVYNAINEQVQAINDLGHVTASDYDWFGRRTRRTHPDAGVTDYFYDLAGNLTALETANLKEKGGMIEYVYDKERLLEIHYPHNPENNVKYTYGQAGAEFNRAGRIELQEDATGAQEFFYGPLGEVVKNIRTVVIPQHDEQTHTTEWQYDTWNRLVSMTYADGEVVTYDYNAGGLLRSMSGKKKNAKFSYVKQLGYDKFEQRVFIAYGNGTKMTYDYEPDRRRLKNMTAVTANNRAFMDNTYEYDLVNNILSLKNNAPVPSPNLMGGSSEYVYEYDNLYRLKTAKGSYKGANEEHSYTLDMEYNNVGGILQKTQVHQRNGHEQKKTTYDMAYAYGDEQPNAPIHIGNKTYSYDPNGNQTGWTSDISGQRRQIAWDEENRIRAISDNGAMYHYIYDAAGERVLKGHSSGQSVYVDGKWKAGSGQMGNYTVYVNPYLVLKSGGYTKHYYIEGQRIVSKLGGGYESNSGQGPLKAGNGKVKYDFKTQEATDGIVRNLKFLGDDGSILTAGKSGKVPPGQIIGENLNTAEKFQYFYHPDHLGSTSYITDASGEVYQHLEYFAFGETFVEEHSNTNRTPYLYNGKELDEETGLYYYGARYYDPQISVWLSVDPMTDQIPGSSSYVFSGNNPIILQDPDGSFPELAPNVIPVVTSRTKFNGKSSGNYAALGNYWNLRKQAIAYSPALGERAKHVKNKENLNGVLGGLENPWAVLGSIILNIPISSEKGNINDEISRISHINDMADIENQQFEERRNEANTLMNNLDIANESDVFGEKLSENTILDITNYKMISKYGRSEGLEDKQYNTIFKGGNSKEYLKKLNVLSKKFDADFNNDKSQFINLINLDRPPKYIYLESNKYEH